MSVMSLIAGASANWTVTILKGFFAAGKPRSPLKEWGSFENWTALIRQAIVWCGYADPGETRRLLAGSADTEAGALRAFVKILAHIDSEGRGLSASDLLDRANQGDEDLLEALYSLCSHSKGAPTARSLGMKLHHLKGRVVGSYRLERTGSEPPRWIAKDIGTRATNRTSSP